MINFSKRLLFVGIILTSSVNVYSQSKIDTFYYNNNLTAVPPEKANIIAITIQKDSFLTAYEYTSDMKIKSMKNYHLRKQADKDDYRVEYGAFEDYHDNGQLQAKSNVVEGELQDTFLSYYEDGKALRIDQYEAGRLTKGQCFDKQGKEIDYFPYQVLPEFSGGIEELFKYLNKNIHYPKDARESNIEDIVYIGFVIDKDGTVKDVTLRKDTYKSLAEEGIRVVKTMPNWHSGLRDGEKISFRYTLPIKFQLEDGFRLRDLFKRN